MNEKHEPILLRSSDDTASLHIRFYFFLSHLLLLLLVSLPFHSISFIPPFVLRLPSIPFVSPRCCVVPRGEMRRAREGTRYGEGEEGGTRGNERMNGGPGWAAEYNGSLIRAVIKDADRGTNEMGGVRFFDHFLLALKLVA